MPLAFKCWQWDIFVQNCGPMIGNRAVLVKIMPNRMEMTFFWSKLCPLSWEKDAKYCILGIMSIRACEFSGVTEKNYPK